MIMSLLVIRKSGTTLRCFGPIEPILVGLVLIVSGCGQDVCPSDTDPSWLDDGQPQEILQTSNTPEALVGATLTADGEHLVIVYTDPELGPVRVTYRMSNPRRVN